MGLWVFSEWTRTRFDDFKHPFLLGLGSFMSVFHRVHRRLRVTSCSVVFSHDTTLASLFSKAHDQVRAVPFGFIKLCDDSLKILASNVMSKSELCVQMRIWEQCLTQLALSRLPNKDDEESA